MDEVNVSIDEKIGDDLPIEDTVITEYLEQLEKDRQKWADTYYPLPENFPSKEIIKELSTKYKKIRIRRMAPNEAYILRRLTRAELKQYLAEVEVFRAEVEDDVIETKTFQEELLVEMCTLWPEGLTLEDIRGELDPYSDIAAAGTATMLAADIQEISNMLSDAVGPIEEL